MNRRTIFFALGALVVATIILVVAAWLAGVAGFLLGLGLVLALAALAGAALNLYNLPPLARRLARYAITACAIFILVIWLGHKIENWWSAKQAAKPTPAAPTNPSSPAPVPAPARAELDWLKAEDKGFTLEPGKSQEVEIPLGYHFNIHAESQSEKVSIKSAHISTDGKDTVSSAESHTIPQPINKRASFVVTNHGDKPEKIKVLLIRRI